MLSAKILDFNPRYPDMKIPIHTEESLENYFINGWAPGGFLMAMLAMDMQRAIATADVVNRQAIWAIGHWIMHNAPEGSWGDYSQIDFWCSDVAGRRSRFSEEMHKKHMWDVLKST